MLRLAVPKPAPASIRLGVNGVNVPGGLGATGATVCPGCTGRSGVCAIAKVGASRQTTNTTLSVSRKWWFTGPRGNDECNGVFSLFRSRRVKKKGNFFAVFAMPALTLRDAETYHARP